MRGNRVHRENDHCAKRQNATPIKISKTVKRIYGKNSTIQPKKFETLETDGFGPTKAPPSAQGS